MWSDQRWRDAWPCLAVGGLIAVGLLIAAPGRVGLDALGYTLLGVAVVALLARRRAPVPVLALTMACLVMYQGIGYPGVVGAIPVLIAVYAAVGAGHARLTLAAIGAGVVGMLAGDVMAAGGMPGPDVVERRGLLIGWLVASAVMAEVLRQRRAYLEQVEQRAADAEKTRDEVARRRAGEERLRIARDLHDSLTHSISVIKVQVGVAVHLARKRDEEVPPALLAIQEASAEAMRELRATLEVLRADRDEPPGSGLDRLDELVERARGAGLPVTVTIGGRQRELPETVDRAAYRIVQEALTNVTRHAGPTSAAVHLDYRDGELTVRVDDDGHATPDAAVVPGVGLIGMRERVAALGGTLRAGPRPEKGFRVRAELPL